LFPSAGWACTTVAKVSAKKAPQPNARHFISMSTHSPHPTIEVRLVPAGNHIQFEMKKTAKCAHIRPFVK
jgi:hypothetical protein